MDVVMVSPKAEPPVVRITEWSKVGNKAPLLGSFSRHFSTRSPLLSLDALHLSVANCRLPRLPLPQVLYEAQKKEKAALKQRLQQQRAAEPKEVGGGRLQRVPTPALRLLGVASMQSWPCCRCCCC